MDQKCVVLEGCVNNESKKSMLGFSTTPVRRSLQGYPYSSHPCGSWSWRYRVWDMKLCCECVQVSEEDVQKTIKSLEKANCFVWMGIKSSHIHDASLNCFGGESIVMPMSSSASSRDDAQKESLKSIFVSDEDDLNEDSQPIVSSDILQRDSKRRKQNIYEFHVTKFDNVSSINEELENDLVEQKNEKGNEDIPLAKKIDYCWSCGTKLYGNKEAPTIITYWWNYGTDLAALF